MKTEQEKKKNKGCTLALSFGRYGGFYIHWSYTKRICLGWMAITFIPEDIDYTLMNILNTQT